MKSFIESFIDVGSGFILAVLIQLLIFPFFGLSPTILDSIGIALIFTGVSITRSWLWRLLFKKVSVYKNQKIFITTYEHPLQASNESCSPVLGMFYVQAKNTTMTFKIVLILFTAAYWGMVMYNFEPFKSTRWVESQLLYLPSSETLPPLQTLCPPLRP